MDRPRRHPRPCTSACGPSERKVVVRAPRSLALVVLTPADAAPLFGAKCGEEGRVLLAERRFGE